MKLLNVRLGPEDARKVADLRKEGVSLSRVVRDAIRAAHERSATTRGSRRRASEIMAEIYYEHPDPPGLPRAICDSRDRRDIRRLIRRRLRRERS